ncbi:MAG: C40 family peptidase [Candidatus Competibacteraceae bacterium]|nr:C40 family peptidase [Candidatus Competibacteraceae bacterium]
MPSFCPPPQTRPSLYTLTILSLEGTVVIPIPPCTHRAFLALLLSGLFWLGGCAAPSAPLRGDPHTVARQRILGTAERLIGTPYVLGGESPGGVDCSGLVQYAYLQAGIRLPRTAMEQFRSGRPRRKVLPGDLLFFRTGNNGRVSHVGIYAGKGQMIHASSGSGQVRKVSLNRRYWRQRLVGGATFLGGTTSLVRHAASTNGGPSG